MFTDNSSFIILFTNSINDTKLFYNSIKADLIEEEPNKVVYRLGSNELHFVDQYGVEDVEYRYNNIGQLGQGMIIYIGAENIEKTHKIITNSNPKNITQIKPNSWESKEFLFEDNNGYKFVCYEDLLGF